MIIHTAIIDDDPINIEDLKIKLEMFCPEVIVVAEFKAFSEAALQLESIHFDLLIIKYSPLDYDESDIRSTFPENLFHIIWLIDANAHSFPLPEGLFDASLPAPVASKKLRLTVTHIIEQLVSKKQSSIVEDQIFVSRNYRLAVSEKRSIIFIQIPDILFFQSDGNYTKIIFLKNNCTTETVLASKNLLHFETRVISFDFVRIHQSILVNCSKISRVEKNSSEVILIDGTILPIARDRKKDVLLRLLR
ncbi:MAG: LytTR family transcriptional regulator DNA-binding domain-containing protein [Bacteroidota bacterium]